ncbi:MAG: arylesterase [Rhodospirillaceae bacterium]
MIKRTLTTRRGVLLALVSLVMLSGYSVGSYAGQLNSDQRFIQIADSGTRAEALRILVLGDSLTAGYGLEDLALAFPARLQEDLQAKGYNVEILDAGISGDTTSGGRSRLDWSLAEDPHAVIVELGGNDGLRAIDPDVTYDNLKTILTRLNAEGLPVLLAGMMAPPNLGRNYGDQFFGVYTRLAGEFDVVFYPFFLDGVAGEADLNQNDRIHPNPEGVNVIVGKILPYVEQLIERAEKTQAVQAKDSRSQEPRSSDPSL